MAQRSQKGDFYLLEPKDDLGSTYWETTSELLQSSHILRPSQKDIARPSQPANVILNMTKQPLAWWPLQRTI